MTDAPLNGGWLLEALGGDFALLANGWTGPVPDGVRTIAVDGLAAARLGLPEGAACLVRPDQYVAARWKTPRAEDVEMALTRAKGGAACLH